MENLPEQTMHVDQVDADAPAIFDTPIVEAGPVQPDETGEPTEPVPEEPVKKKKSKQSRKLRPIQGSGKQASVAQIRDLRLLTQFVKDFELKIKQSEIDQYLGFKERTSRRLRKQKTKSELVAEGLLDRHPRADNAKKARECKGKNKPKKTENKPPIEQPIEPAPEVLPHGYAQALPAEYDPMLLPMSA